MAQTPPNVAPLPQEHVEPLRAAWPSSKSEGRPEGRVVGYDSLCKELSPHDPCEPGHRALASQVVVALATELSDESDIYRLLDALRHEAPILLVEHDMDAVFALADRISVLVYGRVLMTGTVAEVRASAEVRAAYLGDAA